MSKILTVFGATGNQGGSVINAVLADAVLSKQFKIRGITRDVNRPSAQHLTAKGVEMVKGDMSSPETISHAVRDAHTVFLVTNFWESMSAEIEISQGKAVVDASKAAGVKHIVFSSLINTTKASNGRLSKISHFDGKAHIEEYIRQSGVPGTFVLPGMFMSGFLSMIRKNEQGGFTLALPVSPEKALAPLFDVVRDMGNFVKPALLNFPDSANKQILAATDYYSVARLISEFSETIGKPAQAVQIPADTFKSFLPPKTADELLENMLLLEDPGYYAGADLTESLSLLDNKPTTWKEYVEENKAKWLGSDN